jgi:SAM-dependent methyltransferase
MGKRYISPPVYWEQRYADGRDSGEGSQGDNAIRKAELVNGVVDRLQIGSIVDFGTGDGNVLEHITEKVTYLGVDITPTALKKLVTGHLSRFFIYDPLTSLNEDQNPLLYLRADLSLSMDVIFHLVEDRYYRHYLDNLFRTARKAVLIWGTDYDGGITARHVHRRSFTKDIAQLYPEWTLAQKPDDPETAGAYLYVPADNEAIAKLAAKYVSQAAKKKNTPSTKTGEELEVEKPKKKTPTKKVSEAGSGDGSSVDSDHGAPSAKNSSATSSGTPGASSIGDSVGSEK